MQSRRRRVPLHPVGRCSVGTEIERGHCGPQIPALGDFLKPGLPMLPANPGAYSASVTLHRVGTFGAAQALFSQVCQLLLQRAHLHGQRSPWLSVGPSLHGAPPARPLDRQPRPPAGLAKLRRRCTLALGRSIAPCTTRCNTPQRVQGHQTSTPKTHSMEQPHGMAIAEHAVDATRRGDGKEESREGSVSHLRGSELVAPAARPIGAGAAAPQRPHGGAGSAN